MLYFLYPSVSNKLVKRFFPPLVVIPKFCEDLPQDRNILRQFLEPTSATAPTTVLHLERKRFSLVKDKYPKARLHLLLVIHDEFLPARTVKQIETSQMSKLREISAFIDSLRKEIECNVAKSDCPILSSSVRDELHSTLRQGSLRIGFHAKPSLYPLHIHILSDDMDSPAMKNKKHWNSFTSAFFVPLQTVIDTLSRESEQQSMVHKLPPDYELEEMLKGDLVCHKCAHSFPNIPQLKRHLTAEH